MFVSISERKSIGFRLEKNVFDGNKINVLKELENTFHPFFEKLWEDWEFISCSLDGDDECKEGEFLFILTVENKEFKKEEI